MKESLTYFLFALTSLFTIVNPLSAMPFFTSLTQESDSEFSRLIALRAALAAFCAMLFFAISGKFVFSFFNVSVDGLKVVGGVLFFINGYDLLQGRDSRTKSLSAGEKMDIQDVKIRAITPLAIPLICGPGTITVMTVMMHDSTTLTHRLLLFLATVLVSVATYFVLVSSKRITRLIGESGQKVFFRLMGLILMMIAVEYFFNGLSPYVHRMIKS